MIDFLPGGYDSFVYLDTDTRILDDIDLGFRKAERHGFALAPAPNYNLPEYFNFRALMPQLGGAPSDQLLYNAGVIFFMLSPQTRQALERWRDLCAGIGAQNGWQSNQAFLTAAFEQLGITPYVLSPAYNYRALGEFAVGRIRLWHSHALAPSDVNHFATAWPPRAFKDTARLSTPLGEPPRPPQSMLRLPLSTSLPRGAVEELIEVTRASAKTEDYREANRILLDSLGVALTDDHPQSYYAEALDYHIGLLHAHAQRPDAMARHIQRSHTMPTAESNRLFSDHVNSSLAVQARQVQGIARGMPPILLACMPRSASGTLAHSIAHALNIPIMRLSVGEFPNAYLCPSWLDMFLAGGAITQDHFGANQFNRGVLRKRLLRDIFVVIRDPRAAARSQVHFLGAEAYDHDEPLERRIERECVEHFIPWLQGWLDRAAAGPGQRIHWLTYREVCADLAAVLRKMSATLGDQSRAMAAYADCRSVTEVRTHFVTGDDDAWRAEVGEDARARLWAACPPEIKELLQLKP